MFGQLHEDTLQSASNLAILLSQQQPLTAEAFGEARRLYALAISGREASAGPDHPRTLYTVSNLAKLLSEFPDSSCEILGEADKLHERAADKLKEALGDQHPLTLAALHNQACHWLACSAFRAQSARSGDRDARLDERALAQLRQVHNKRMEKLGKEHPDTLATERVLRSETRRDRLSGGSARTRLANYSSWKDLSVEEYPEICSAKHFAEMRALVREFGVSRLKSELVTTGYVDPESETLTVGMQPFNVFARMAAGVMVQASMVEAQTRLGRFQDEFLVACNKPEYNDMWESSETAWVGKASMSERHVFFTVKDLRWEWFNVLTFGLISGIDQGIKKLQDMREAALVWAEATDGWPPRERVGLYLHVYAHCSVNSMHLHVVDAGKLGPSYEKLAYKNLPLDDAIKVLMDEKAAKVGATGQ